MADLTITATDLDYDGTPTVGTAGETIAASDSIYYDSANSVWMQADASADDGGNQVAVALSGGATGQAIIVAKDRDKTLTVGSVLTVGETYVVSANAGKIAPISDLVSTNYVVYIGYATSATEMKLLLRRTATAKA